VKTKENALHINMHELGHSFGGLDEGYSKGFPDITLEQYKNNYLNNSNIAANWDIEGCPKWCSGKINTNSICYKDYLNYKNCLFSNQTKTDQEAGGCLENFNNVLINKGIKIGPYACDFGVNCLGDTNCWLEGVPFFRAYDEDIMYTSPSSYPIQTIFSRGYGPTGGEHIKKTIDLLLKYQKQRNSIDYVNFKIVNSSITKIEDNLYKVFVEFELTDVNKNRIIIFSDKILDPVFEIKYKQRNKLDYSSSFVINSTPNNTYKFEFSEVTSEKKPELDPIDFIFEIQFPKFKHQWNYTLGSI
jgi:hypothetical protein